MNTQHKIDHARMIARNVKRARMVQPWIARQGKRRAYWRAIHCTVRLLATALRKHNPEDLA